MGILGALLIGFKAWMLIDAIQRSGARGGNNYWFLICWIPFGDWAYFFAVKIHDPEFSRIWRKFFQKRISLDDLRYAYKMSPSALNKLTLAQALHDKGQFEEAVTLSEELLKFEPDNKVYQFLHASCLIGMKKIDEASGVLETLIEKDFSFRNYEAATTLALLYVEKKEGEKAVQLYRRVVKSSSQLRYQIELARILAEQGNAAEARQIVDDAIQQFKHEPKFIQRRDRRELGVAKKVRKMLESGVAGEKA